MGIVHKTHTRATQFADDIRITAHGLFVIQASGKIALFMAAHPMKVEMLTIEEEALVGIKGKGSESCLLFHTVNHPVGLEQLRANLIYIRGFPPIPQLGIGNLHFDR